MSNNYITPQEFSTLLLNPESIIPAKYEINGTPRRAVKIGEDTFVEVYPIDQSYVETK